MFHFFKKKKKLDEDSDEDEDVDNTSGPIGTLDDDDHEDGTLKSNFLPFKFYIQHLKGRGVKPADIAFISNSCAGLYNGK